MLYAVAMRSEGAKAAALAREIAASGAEPQVKEAAAVLLKKSERVGKPLDIQFTALDGRKVDLAKLKGKVVLIDFWATWCGPCVAEIPHIKATYEKLNPKGFEVIGISLDDDKAALQAMVKHKQLPGRSTSSPRRTRTATRRNTALAPSRRCGSWTRRATSWT